MRSLTYANVGLSDPMLTFAIILLDSSMRLSTDQIRWTRLSRNNRVGKIGLKSKKISIDTISLFVHIFHIVGCEDMETCQIREQRTPQKRRGAISAEVYTDEEVFMLNIVMFLFSIIIYLGCKLCQKSYPKRL